MAKGREVRIAILGDSRDFSRAVKSVQGDAGKLDRAFGGISAGAARMGKAVALGVGALAVGGAALAKGFVDAAIESQKVTKQTEAVLKSMGKAAGVTSKQVAALSTKLSLQTGIDDELIQSGENLLLTFGNIRNGTKKTEKNFDRATAAALDMSVAMKTDMKSAAMLVGKALNDPIKGMGRLSKAGVDLSDKQKDLIKWMVKTGDVAGAQNILLKELERQFGGSAAAQATAGEKLKVVWGNIQEQLGEKLLPVLNTVASWLSDRLPGAIAKATPFLEDAARFFSDVGEATADLARKGLKALGEWWDKNGPAITTGAKDLASAFKDKVVPALTVFVDYVLKDVIPMFGRLIVWMADNKVATYAFATAVGVLAAAWLAATAPIAAAVVLILALGAATTWAINLPAFGKLLQWGIDIAAAIWDLAKALGKAVPQLQALIGLASSAASLLPDIPGLGSSEAKVNPLTGEPTGGGSSGGGSRGGGSTWGRRSSGSNVAITIINPTQEPVADSLRTARREAALMGT